MKDLASKKLIHNSWEEGKEGLDKKTFGDIVAVSLVGTYTLLALIISSWSAILMMTGNTESESPIAVIFTELIWPMIT